MLHTHRFVEVERHWIPPATRKSGDLTFTEALIVAHGGLTIVQQCRICGKLATTLIPSTVRPF